MIKTETIKKEVEIKIFFCDKCHNEVDKIRSCCICHKHICNNCIANTEDDGSDYNKYYCADCWSIGQVYIANIKALEDKIESLNDEWIERCRK